MSGPETPRALSRGRKIAFSIILGLVVLLVVEGLAQLTYQVIHDHSYRPQKLRKLTTDSWVYGGEETGVPDFLANLVIHPYFGFAVDAKGEAREALGFSERSSPLDSLRHEGKLRVLVLGGSVAVQLMQPERAGGTSFLESALEKALEQSDREPAVWVFNGAQPGFKQPQQYMAYSFLLTQGAQFDLVVNLDGFNEMTLAMLDGRTKGLHPAYPRGWDVMLGNRLTAGKLRKLARLMKVREDQASLIEFAQSTPLARPAMVGLFLARRIVANERRAQVLVREIERQRQEGELTLEEGGIPFPYDDEAAAYGYLAALWMRSSVLLSQLAKQNGARYLHVFQPNQYLEGSKALTELERDKFYDAGGLIESAYRAAYPSFRRQMDGLSGAGDWFVDASMVFKDENRTLYSDVCCHFNELGLRLLAEFIAGHMVERMRERMGADHVLPTP